MGLRERNKKEKLARISRAARELFAEQGFDGTTGRQICERAGIGTGTLFLYVKHKRELLFLIFQEEVRRLYAEGMRRASATHVLPDALMELFGSFFEFYARQPRLAKDAMRELTFPFHEREPESAGRLNAEFLQHVSDLVRQAIDRGELRPDVDVLNVSAACFSQVGFWHATWLGAGRVGREEAEARLRASLHLLMEGIGAPTCAASGSNEENRDDGGLR